MWHIRGLEGVEQPRRSRMQQVGRTRQQTADSCLCVLLLWIISINCCCGQTRSHACLLPYCACLLQAQQAADCCKQTASAGAASSSGGGTAELPACSTHCKQTDAAAAPWSAAAVRHTGGLSDMYEVKHLLGSGSAGDAWLCRCGWFKQQQ
jgi:hypothetical protein